MLIDVHAHFLHDRTPRADWRERNASRLRAGERVGITIHVASILGSWGLTLAHLFSVARRPALRQRLPARAPAPAPGADPRLRHRQSELHRRGARRDPALPRRRHDRHQARRQPPRQRSAARSRSAVWRPSAACRSCTTSGSTAAGSTRGRKPPTPGSSASSPRATRTCASSWPTSAAAATGCTRCTPCAACRTCSSISRAAAWMAACSRPASTRSASSGSLWGCDLTIETGWAKLRYLEHLLSPAELERVRWRNAAGIFPPGAFPAD